MGGVNPLTRLIDAAKGDTLPYSFEVKVSQEDLRLVLGAFFFGVSPWDLNPTYQADALAMTRELLDTVPPTQRFTGSLVPIGLEQGPQG